VLDGKLYPADMQEPTAGAIFADRLSKARKGRDMTQARMSVLLRENYGVRIDPTGILRIEKGQRSPRLDEVVAMADLLNIHVVDLLSIPALLAKSDPATRRLEELQLEGELKRLDEQITRAAAAAASARINRHQLEEERSQVELRLAALQAAERCET
jgi:transcriptional regulator with XRE-family HTH domain